MTLSERLRRAAHIARPSGVDDRLREAADTIDALVEALAGVRAAIEQADPDVLVCTLWMPDEIAMNETVVDYIDAALAKAKGVDNA